MYFCIICNRYHEESEMVMYQSRPYPNRYGFCLECDKSYKTTFADIDLFFNGGEQMSLF